jgi:hypothetical protein|nr:MAG TPA: hypothetical protein [Bacteriophage sp.]DAF14580.1 MAG TPA: hypothetical protein [Crassvirales sp.]
MIEAILGLKEELGLGRDYPVPPPNSNFLIFLYIT